MARQSSANRTATPTESRWATILAALMVIFAFATVLLVVSGTELWNVGWLRNLLWEVFLACCGLAFGACCSCFSRNARFRQMAFSWFLKFVFTMFVTTALIIAYCFVMIGK